MNLKKESEMCLRIAFTVPSLEGQRDLTLTKGLNGVAFTVNGYNFYATLPAYGAVLRSKCFANE